MKKGISLIVLSITILVMAILAAAVIISLEDSGIIGRAKNTTTNQNYAEEYTRLQVIKNGIMTDNLGEITVEEYIDELRTQGVINGNETTNVDGSVTVTTTSGIDVTILKEGTYDLKILIEGYNHIAVELISFTVSDLTNSITNVQCQAEVGMTWEEWIESKYNTNGFSIEDATIYKKTGTNTTQVVDSSNIIENGADYYIV